jgi:hypothetical protein
MGLEAKQRQTDYHNPEYNWLGLKETNGHPSSLDRLLPVR